MNFFPVFGSVRSARARKPPAIASSVIVTAPASSVSAGVTSTIWLAFPVPVKTAGLRRPSPVEAEPV